ncbi:MAG TPA: hypothetical protein VM142_14735 [Acidimicrobiales bacterium]|nr:hypothetical protein [Acidimicrobiales bacterium]
MRRPVAILTSALLVAVSGVALGGATTPVSGQVAHKDAAYNGYSTGTVVHADALQGLALALPGLPGAPPPGGNANQVANAEVAFSGATVASKGTDAVTPLGPRATAGTIVNEVDQVVQPDLPAAALPGDKSYGRGSAIEVGLLTPLPDPLNTAILSGKAEASAPPSTDLVDKSITVPVNPVAYASLLRGQAKASWDADNCILGEPISFGRGLAADAQLLNTGAVLPGGIFEKPLVATDAPNPERAASQSQSVTRLVPQVDIDGKKIGDNFGLMSETRMTIAPITLFKNTPSQLTVEFLGEWVLRAVATGINDGGRGAYMFYGPGKTSAQNNQTPVLRVLQGTDPNTPPVVNVTLQQVLDLGLRPVLESVSNTLNGLVPGTEISVAENPRGINNYTPNTATQGGDGTLASGALDVVRVRVADVSRVPGLQQLPASSVLDVRIGHMEALARVPAGGIKCQLPVQKTSDKQLVNAGETFTYSIKVDNPFADCELTDVRVEDTITVESGVRHSVTGTSPTANSVSDNKIVWNDIGPIPARGSKTVAITVAVAGNSGSGLFTDNAKATGNCATGSAQGAAKIVVPVSGEVTVVVPRAGGPAELPLSGSAPAELPKTGGDATMPLVGLALLAAAAAARRLSVSTSR